METVAKVTQMSRRYPKENACDSTVSSFVFIYLFILLRVRIRLVEIPLEAFKSSCRWMGPYFTHLESWSLQIQLSQWRTIATSSSVPASNSYHNKMEIDEPVDHGHDGLMLLFTLS